ncbi:MAG: YgfZ/GcvT domain-containing protein [Candidatus Tisiphia sp.]|jgi:folate-binding protein YgfZ|uniref:CAF17-like 4Fe-4S cluster assembly/insertion protein YgfZ n=1 Tax=Candidatus Tisiphia endosymbiont of Melanophora roralis TaxID=3066261 RepID=UPI001E7CA120|nr:MAG: folate-binding protein [Rickettsia endosymbiont of Cimex lectularius]
MHEILTNRAIIEVAGDDAMNFLHNLTTNDIKNNNYCYSYALSNQGRYLFDFFVLKLSATRLFIDINVNQSDLFKNHLVRYKLRAKIEVNDLSNIYQVIYSKQQLEFNGYKDPRYDQLGFRSIVSKDIPITAGTLGLYLQDKYNFAIVDGYDDLIFNRSIPVEYGCEELNAVSYIKGCYIGQEVISRTKYQGVVRKKIFKLSVNIDSINTGSSDIAKDDEIIANNIKIGTICSIYQNMAIALIREDDYYSLQNTAITVKNLPVSLVVPPWRSCTYE